MTARTHLEAQRLFDDTIKSALFCVTRVHAIAQYAGRDSNRYTLAFVEPLAALGRNRVLQLKINHSVELIRSQEARGWIVRTTSYSYWFYDADGTELFTYQWEPEGRSPVKTPHVHVGKALGTGDIPDAVRRRFSRLASAHLPTGLISITDILRTAIRDFGVEPVRRAPGDSATIDWDGVDRLFRAADTVLRNSFAGTGGGHEP